jgi:hypothetical protein
MAWSTDDIKRLIALEERLQGVPAGLGLAVATQESYLSPEAKGDNGRSLGLFQLQEAAAKDAGIDPARRLEVPLNIEGGIRYLKQKLDQSGGNIDQALSRYNRGTPDYRGIGDPNYVQHVRRFYQPAEGQPPPARPGLVQRVVSAVSPASAEAATPAPTGRSRLEELEAELARRTTQQPPGATPSPAPDPEAQHADATLARLRAQQDPAARLATGGQPMATPTPVTDPAARLAVGGGETREQQILAEAQARQQRGEVPAGTAPPGGVVLPRPPADVPLEEGVTKPSTMIPLLMPGAGIKMLPEAVRQGTGLVARAARPVVEGLSQTLGWGTGKTIETGQVPSAGEVATEAALNIGTSAVPEVVGAARDVKRALLRSTPGGQTLLKQQAVQEAEGLGQRVFTPQDKAAVSQMFDDVAASRVKLDVTPVQDLWKSLSAEERRLAVRELNHISPRFTQALAHPQLKGWDIGALQHLRSELLKAAKGRKAPAVQDLLIDLRSKVDEAIAAGKAVGSVPIGTTAETLQQAQAAWHKVKQAEDLQSLITKHTHDSPNLKWQEINLAALQKDLRGGGSRAASRVVEGMSQGERQVLRQELDSLKRFYPFVRVNRLGSAALGVGGSVVGSAIGGPVGAVVPLILSAAASSPTVMSLFKKSILEGRGRLAQHHIDALVNAIRHEQAGPSGTPQ